LLTAFANTVSLFDLNISTKSILTFTPIAKDHLCQQLFVATFFTMTQSPLMDEKSGISGVFANTRFAADQPQGKLRLENEVDFGQGCEVSNGWV